MLFVSIRAIIFLIGVSVFSLSHAQEKTATTILLFGDSITAGYGLAPEDVLSAQLQKSFAEKHYNINVINGGISGDTTSGGLSRLEWTIKKHHPDIVFIALGGNDVLRGISPKITYSNLDAMLALLKTNNIPAILSAVQAPSNLGVEYARNFNQIYPDLAAKYKVPLYPFLLHNIFGNATLMQSDGIHPTALGVKDIAQELAPYLAAKIAKK